MPSSQQVLSGWEWGRAKVAALIALLVLAPLVRSEASEPSPVEVIVRFVQGRGAAAEHDVERVGGRIDRAFPTLGGFSATIPSEELRRLRMSRAIVAVTPNASMNLLTYQPSLEYDPDLEFGSMYRTTRIVDAHDTWNARFTGAGVDVALIDSGVAPVEGLTSAGKIIDGPDLSFDSQSSSTRYLDAYGHGTHMAGIIAGRDEGAVPSFTDKSRWVGVAPDARIVNVKVASANGATDVSQVLAGIDWVVQHRNSNGLNIRVLNLSFGTNSVQDYRIDPLAYAVEVAWRHGITVVVAAGNGGQATTTLTDPAIDPFVIAVSADEPNGTESASDDTVASFASAGNAARHPDVIAPGRSVIGLRVPGSYLDLQYPTARVGSRFFRGSGTSQATAVVSGVVALLLQQRPSLSPDQVKWILRKSATQLKGASIPQGDGLVSSKAARLTPTPSSTTALQTFEPAKGTGSLEAARGDIHVSDAGGELRGERDIFGKAWNGQTWSVAALAGQTWSGGDWNGSTWSGNSWSGNSWSGNSWSGNSWSGNSWSGNSWSGQTWSGQTWSGNSWSGQAWSGQTWSGITWSANAWNDSAWAGVSWGR